MKKITTFLLSALSLLAFSATAQPGYYKTSTNVSANQYPLGSTGGAARVQELYRPSEFNTVPPAGLITKIYFRSILASTTATYTNFKVGFIQNTVTAFPSNTFYTIPAYSLAPTGTFTVTTSATASATNPDWVGITLATPFTYDNTKSLIVEIQYTAVTNPISTVTEAATGVDRRIVSATATATTGTVQVIWNDFGIDVATIPGCVPAPTTPTNAGTACAGVTTLSWPAVTGATGYDVYLNSGATATTIVSTNQAGTSFSTAALTPGAYSWKVIPKNVAGAATGCTTFTFTVNATVTPSVTIAASPTGTICAGTPVTFTATPVNGGATPAFQWKKGTVNVGTNANTYTDNTLVNGDVITAVLTSNEVCPSPATGTSNAITASVLPRPDTSVTVSGATTFCQGGSVVLGTSGAAGLTYQWLLNNGVIAGATSSSYTANASGDYRVLVFNSTCSDTSSVKTVTVNPIPTATVIPAGPLSICSNATTTLSVSTTAGATYQWKKGGVDIAGATSATYTANAAGSYTAAVTSLGCSATSNAVIINVNPTPGATATAGGPLAFCQGSNVTLTGSSTLSSGVTYQWLRAGLTIGGAINPTYVATTSGAYTVRIANTTTGCADTSSPPITVTVSTPPSTAITQVGTSPICQGGNVRYTSSNPLTYVFQWYKDGVAIPGAITNTYIATVAGVYYVTIINGTCTATSVTRTLVVNPLPSAAIVANGATAFCNGGSVVLDGGLTSGLTYQWRLNNINIPGATSATYTATQSGAYTLVVTNANGCSATSNIINVTVSASPVPVITSTGSTTFCQGNSITLEATTGAGYTYQWLLNGNPIPGANAATYGAAASGSYTVIITNGTCVATSAPFVVTVLPAPPAVITPAGPTAFCQGGSVTLNANRGTGLTYQWTRNTTDIPGATGYQYTATTNGTYTVKISDGTCPATSAAVTVTVNEFPVAVITVTGGVDMITDIFSSYQWYRNGVAIQGATGQAYTAVRDGYYAVVVTDALGCSATSSITRITALDVQGVPGGSVSVYPNPTDGLVRVKAAIATDLTVTGVDGRVLLTATASDSIDMGLLAQGMYLLRVTSHSTGQLLSQQKIVRK